MRKLKIGILGSQGIPNHYGGFEQCAEYLALGLHEKGHEVWVYNRHNHEHAGSTWSGVHIVHCLNPDRYFGATGQFVYDFNCLRDASRRSFDVLLQLGYTSSSIWHKLWPKHCINIVNMDGLEWKRAKYSRHARQFLKYAEKLAAVNADLLVADSEEIQRYLGGKYATGVSFIPYGAQAVEHADGKLLEKFNLQHFGYHLLIARMVPENNVSMIIDGVIASSDSKPLIVVGNINDKFGRALKAKYQNNNRIHFPGGIYEKDVLDALRYYSYLYFHGHTVGGTNPSLLEAMACGALIAAHDNVFNKGILGDDAFYFSDTKGIAALINSTASREHHRQMTGNNLKKIVARYNWATIVDEYEKLFLQAVSK